MLRRRCRRGGAGAAAARVNGVARARRPRGVRVILRARIRGDAGGSRARRRAAPGTRPTTRARAGQGLGSAVPETYEAVDYGLTAMLIDAAALLTPPPRFVYLSAAGVTPHARNAYLAARARVEAKLAASSLTHVIARPGLITGDDRDEARTGERVGAVVMQGLSALGRVAGFGRALHRRYATMTGAQLAAGLLTCTLRSDGDGDGNRDGDRDGPEGRGRVLTLEAGTLFDAAGERP